MDTCFLTSNSFTKTIEFVPSIKARLCAYPRRNSNQFHARKVGSSSPTATCCWLESSSSSEDANRPLVDTDWKSFRARLVAGDRASRPDEPSSAAHPGPSSAAHPDKAVDPPPQITVGDKWAHRIHEPEKG